MDFGLLVTKTYIQYMHNHNLLHIHMFVFIHTLFCQVEAVGAAASQAFSDLKVQVLSATHAEVKNKETKTEGEVSNIHTIRIHILESKASTVYACFIRLLVNSVPVSVFLSKIQTAHIYYPVFSHTTVNYTVLLEYSHKYILYVLHYLHFIAYCLYKYICMYLI